MTLFANRARYASCVISCLLILLALTTNAQAKSETTRTDNSKIFPAVSGGQYAPSATMKGLQVANSVHDISIDGFGQCRYMDVNATPGGQGILVPFATYAEWVRGSGQMLTGFLSTMGSRNFIKQDFCRALVTVPTDYARTGGLSDPSSLAPGESAIRQHTLPQTRIDTRSTDEVFADSLKEHPKSESFNMTRNDCLGNTTYPDGSVRNPCYRWSWIEEITASFIDTIGKTKAQAANDAKMVPVQTLTEVWTYTLARSACTGPNGVSSDGRPVPGNSCPPPVKKPTLRSCQPQNHNQRHWQTVSTGNVRNLHDCGPGYVEDPTRRYTYDLQAEYWCFDATDYPTGQTRESSGVTSGRCVPIVNGQVGPAHGSSIAGLNASSPGLCNVGAVINFTATNTGWAWACKGSNGGVDAQGYADKKMDLVSTCAAASNQLGGAGNVTSSCSRYNSNNNTCEGTNTWTAVNSCCRAGQPNDQSFNVNGFTVNGCDVAAGTCAMNSSSQNYPEAKAEADECISSLGYSANQAPLAGILRRPFGQGSYIFCQNNERIERLRCPNGGGTLSWAGNPECRENVPACPAEPPPAPSCSSNCHQFVSTGNGNVSCAPGGYHDTVVGYQETNYCDLKPNDACCPGSTPTCTPGTEDRQVACPAGQTGAIIERRGTNVGGTCGNYGNWTTYSNTCAPATTYHWDEGAWQAGVCPVPTPACGSNANNACNTGSCNAENKAGVYRNWQDNKYYNVCNCSQWSDTTDQGRYGRGGITQNCPI